MTAADKGAHQLEWKRWDHDDGSAALAAYTAPGAALDLGFQQRGSYELLFGDSSLREDDPAHRTERARRARGILARAYTDLAARGWDYDREADPWARREGQVIRSLDLMDQQKAATCLDLAIGFAAICKLNNLNPHIAHVTVQEDEDGPRVGHALVVVDLLGDLERDYDAPKAFKPLNPRLDRYRHTPEKDLYPEADAAVAVLPANPGDDWQWGDRFVAVDVVLAASGVAREAAGEVLTDRQRRAFEAACVSGREAVEGSVGGLLISVIAAHGLGAPEYAQPRKEAQGALRTPLPQLPELRSYPSRAGLERSLADLRGVVVLYGDSGTGKSELALQAARSGFGGRGWWLTATDQATLDSWLAVRETYESGDDPKRVLEPADVTAIADSARAKLRDAVGPWVVVLDNADLPPKKLKKIPLPRNDRQLLLITTTDPAWLDYPGAHTFTVSGVPDDEVIADLGTVPQVARDAIAGRPLLINATRQFRRATGGDWWDVVGQPMTGPAAADAEILAPAWIWSAVHALPGADASVLSACQALSLLPPTRVAAETFAAFLPGERSAGEAIARYGLAEFSKRRDAVGGAVDELVMHRLFRRVVHESVPEAGPWQIGGKVGPPVPTIPADPGLVGLARRVLDDERTTEVLAASYDPGTVVTLVRLLCDPALPADEHIAALHALGRIVERHATKVAAKLLDRALELMAWSESDPVEDLASSQRLIAVDALRTRARPYVRGEVPEEESRGSRLADLLYGIDLLKTAERICRAEPAAEPARTAASAAELTAEELAWGLAESRSQAMLGIGLRGCGTLYQPTDLGVAREFLNQAATLLYDNYERRKRLAVGPNQPDVDRAQFNLAGLEIVRASLEERHQAAGHLDEAERHYREVYAARLARYGNDKFEDVITCVLGFATVGYFRATLLELPPERKIELLVRAEQDALESAQARADAYDGPLEGSNTVKSLRVAIKALAARMELDRPGAVTAPFVEFGTEWLGMSPNSSITLSTDGRADIVADPKDVPGSFEPVPMVGPDAEGGIAGGIRDWVTSEPIRALVTAFSAPDEDAEAVFGDSEGDLDALLARLDAFTDRWDTRAGAERNLAPELPLTPRQAKLALVAARALGLRDPGRPALREYDHVLVLGGLVRACLVRPDYAARLLREGSVETPSVVALGARRPLAGDEGPLARAMGLPELDREGVGEFEALRAGVRRAFRLGEPESVRSVPVACPNVLPFSGCEQHVFRTEDGLRVVVAAAPSSEPSLRRANTDDTYTWFARELAHLRPGQRILAVTTDIYRPSQHAAALRTLALPYGVQVETVGHIPARVEAAVRQPFTPTKYLQEIRSAIRAYRNLALALRKEA